MHELPLHPAVVHLPLALAVILPLLFVGLLIAWIRGALPKRAWIVAVLLQAIVVGSALYAENTGEQEEERVERAVSHDAVHEHEEAAEAFVGSAFGVLVFAIVAAVIKREPIARGVAALTTVVSIGSAVMAYRAGEAGGRLVYEHGAARAYTHDRAAGSE